MQFCCSAQRVGASLVCVCVCVCGMWWGVEVCGGCRGVLKCDAETITWKNGNEISTKRRKCTEGPALSCERATSFWQLYQFSMCTGIHNCSRELHMDAAAPGSHMTRDVHIYLHSFYFVLLLQWKWHEMEKLRGMWHALKCFRLATNRA